MRMRTVAVLLLIMVAAGLQADGSQESSDLVHPYTWTQQAERCRAMATIFMQVIEFIATYEPPSDLGIDLAKWIEDREAEGEIWQEFRQRMLTTSLKAVGYSWHEYRLFCSEEDEE